MFFFVAEFPLSHTIVGMKQRLSTQLNSVRACLDVAGSSDYRSLWSSNPPAGFGSRIAQLENEIDGVTVKAGIAGAVTEGASDAKAAAERALEDATYVLAHALAVHFKHSGDLERRGKADLTKSELVRLSAQELANKATAIRDLGSAAIQEPGAADCGITAERVDALSRAIDEFSGVMGAPRGKIANRGALLREVESVVAAFMDTLDDLDDLILQFDRTPAGHRFIEAWRRARILVDAGGGSSAPEPAASPPASPAAATQPPVGR